jgi:hypothetical protein
MPLSAERFLSCASVARSSILITISALPPTLWRLNNPEKRNDYEKRRRIKIVDNYVKTNLIAKGFPKETITPELIEVQRLIIKTKRLTKNKLKEQENEKHSRT